MKEHSTEQFDAVKWKTFLFVNNGLKHKNVIFLKTWTNHALDIFVKLNIQEKLRKLLNQIKN